MDENTVCTKFVIDLAFLAFTECGYSLVQVSEIFGFYLRGENQYFQGDE